MPFPLNLFQSTLPREERQTLYGTPTPEFTFQSTLPREERQITDTLICNLRWYFNPRSHERSDEMNPDNDQIMHHFNPRSHERSDGFKLSTSSLLTDFNPRSHERSDNLTISKLTDISLFQSTLPREERRFRTCQIMYFILYFNPRSHERSDKN